MTSVILFVFGTVVGSFLNVVAMHWDTDRGLKGRSKCPSCDKVLKWYELVPILSFVLQLGKCRNCHSRISLEYLVIEILTGLIFMTVPYQMWPVFCIYIVILVYDLKHKIIPDPLVYLAIVLSFAQPLFITHYTLLDWLSGPIMFTFFGLVWLLSKGRAMGFGDAKLALSLGLLLGARNGFSAIILAFWIGALVSLVYLSFNKIGFIKNAKSLTMKSEIPFAPFIILGAWLSLLLDLNLTHVIY